MVDTYFATIMITDLSVSFRLQGADSGSSCSELKNFRRTTNDIISTSGGIGRFLRRRFACSYSILNLEINFFDIDVVCSQL